MSIERFHVGLRMSQVVTYNGTAYTAGQVAQNAGGGSVTAQTEDILAAIDGLLADAGTDKSRLLSATIWLNSMDDFAEMNAVWDAWVGFRRDTGARVCRILRLASAKYTVEIMVIAAAA